MSVSIEEVPAVSGGNNPQAPVWSKEGNAPRTTYPNNPGNRARDIKAHKQCMQSLPLLAPQERMYKVSLVKYGSKQTHRLIHDGFTAFF